MDVSESHRDAPVAEAVDLAAIAADLADVEVALSRLDAGTYFIDEITGRALPDELLAAPPPARPPPPRRPVGRRPRRPSRPPPRLPPRRLSEALGTDDPAAHDP